MEIHKRKRKRRRPIIYQQQEQVRVRSDVEANEKDEILDMRIKLRTEKYEITQKTFNYHQIQDQSNLCMTDTLEEARR